MANYRYIFSGEYLQCPECGAQKKYRRYLDTFTNSFVADECGACFRASCGYDLKPWEYYKQHPKEIVKAPSSWSPPPPPPIAYIPPRYVTESLSKPPFKSNLLIWLKPMFSEQDITNAVELYAVGESMYGAVKWPYIDIKGRVCEIKIQNHNPGNGHRDKRNCYTFHKELRIMNVLPADSRPGRCLFGEHLLCTPNPNKVVCVVESEKTALMMSMALPKYVWVATGGCGGISLLFKVIKQLQSYKKVVIYPDTGNYGEWCEKVNAMGITNAEVSRICEGRARNTDIADIYTFEWLTNPSKPTTPQQPPSPPTPTEDNNTIVALCPQHRLERLTATNPAVALLVDKLELVAVDDDFEPF